MNFHGSRLNILPCIDSLAISEALRKEMDMSRNHAAELGQSAVEFAEKGYYIGPDGNQVDWSREVKEAIESKVSIPPDAELPETDSEAPPYQETRIQVSNETTFGAARRLINQGHKPLALNFASGVHPGGGFLNGARAQEEVLCRSSSLYSTLVGDPMYEAHRRRPHRDSSDWVIYSPNVPVFRTDSGDELDRPWRLSFITCAAPYAPTVGQPESRLLLQKRIHRVLSVARAYHYTTLVLGAWGCGAYQNDPHTTSKDFRQALEGKFAGCFSDVVFAIVDWSTDRRFLRPFREMFDSIIE